MPEEKLIERLKRSPHNATFSDLRRLLEVEGFVLERITGSHHVFRREGAVFVVPVHNNRMKSVYVKRAIAIIEDSKRS
jgi:predicted RNA binding protein YcfA (HicA-like mRNA interferase family)